MDLNQFLLALRARRKAFMLVLIVTVVAALAIALVVPKRYVGTATLLVDMPDTQSLNAPGRGMSARERTGYIQTQVDLLQSGRVARKVVADLKMAQEPGVRELFESATGGIGRIEDWLATALLDKLTVDVSASNVITVNFASSDAAKAATVANAFTHAYMETNLALRTGPTREAADWFEDQLKGLRTQVNQAQERLTRFQKDKGILYVEERGDIEGARLAELSTQVSAASREALDARTRYRQAQEVLKSGTPDALPELMASAAITAVRGDLARAEALFHTAAADLGPNHPVYQRHLGEVQALRSKLTAEMRKMVASLGNSAEQAARREADLKRTLAEQHKQLLAQKDHRIELATLARDVETHQRAYEAALSRLVTTRVDSHATQTNVAVLTPAVQPIEPAFPRVGLISGLALVMGLLLAAGVVFLLETLDRRVRSRGDLESRLAVPSLGRLSKWQPIGGRLLPAPVRATRALPNPW